MFQMTKYNHVVATQQNRTLIYDIPIGVKIMNYVIEQA